ncbi:prepilin peptidase [Trichococcus shcherbakoviae subsp. psychrophilus]|uniref:Prepilin peptidase n=1 Tax=Trichococcus shcherbakoviae subsp. psychrophilus TaxID=2585775 RepID=A0A5C5E5V3_9LACT|nr:prepilin peptidase [Trichococcus shcherbakoviae subsp. psychrophilus]
MFSKPAHKKIQQTSCGYYSQFIRQGGIVLTIVAYISIFYFGAIFGSFFTVLGTRIPIKENFTTTRSHCVHCQHTLQTKDLFPIFSYVSHHGKCAYCAVKIDALYFASEIISGVVACLLYYFYETDLLQLVTLAFVFSLLLVIAIADYLYLLIPDRFQLLLLFGVVFRQTVLPVTDWPAAFISLFVIFSLLFFTSLALQDGIGGGDVKLLSILSLAFGLEPTLFIILLASFSAGSYFLHTHMAKGSPLQRRLPFGPFLAASAVVVHFAQLLLVR